MAVRTFCDDIIKVYTHCDSVMSIYTYGELVWPTGPVPPGQWYVSWQPSNISGSFTMFGQTYRLEDYSGLYTWEGPASTSGMIGGSFRESSMYGEGYKTYMETNVLSIGNAAFQANYHLESISCSRCRHIGENAFRTCYSLQYVSLPRCLDIDIRAFMYCSSISYVSLPVVKTISYGAFEECSNLHSLYAPRCEYISQHAFDGADLYSVDLPMCSCIENDVFWGNHNLSYVSLPVCTRIDGSAFAYCSALTSVYLPVCSEPMAAFVGCTSLESIDLPACTSTVETFRDCTSLSQVSLPLCEYVGYDTFRNCEHLSRVELPKCKSMSYGVFAGCSALSYIDLGECSYITELGPSWHSRFKGAFQDCVNLTTVILRGSSTICSIGSSYASYVFENTPIQSGTGSIYVPSSLVSSYKNATNWRYYSSQIFPIE